MRPKHYVFARTNISSKENMHEAENTVVIVVPRVLEMIHGRIMKTIKSGKGKDVQKSTEGSQRSENLDLNVGRTL